MPKLAKPLTDLAVRNAKPYPDGRARKLAGGGGLYLYVPASGSKLWRWDYRSGGKQKTVSLGSYPDLSLAKARELRDAQKARLTDGTDPAAAKREGKAKAALEAARGVTVAELAQEWFTRRKPTLAPATVRRTDLMISRWIVRAPVGRQVAAEMEPRHVIEALRQPEGLGKAETARRLAQLLRRIFGYGVQTGQLSRNPVADIQAREVLTAVKTKPRAALVDSKAVGALMRAIRGYPSPITRSALLLLAYTFVRPGEVRQAKWEEFDLESADNPVWRIPAARMKMREPHEVPLVPAVVQMLRELPRLDGPAGYLVPGERDASKPMSNMTLLGALRRLGYGADEMTAHGFRAMASTLLNEAGEPPDVIERALAHKEKDKVRAAYNRASYWAARRKLMNRWAGMLEEMARLTRDRDF